jgi:hypothetical protein
MNASPPPIDSADPQSVNASLCSATQLAVPECSCQDCLTRLMQAYAPPLLAAEAR